MDFETMSRVEQRRSDLAIDKDASKAALLYLPVAEASHRKTLAARLVVSRWKNVVGDSGLSPEPSTVDLDYKEKGERGK
ncbi:hypothetical protein L484_022330 [Morus notabilis]|uniref:Uncharacterized protein n=1 Tax=Morus notabilis TaxID=981085 RepID=W9QJC7_9ROSA|nr:hypothetical protein L484_022330 [Morus notabilis]